MSGNRILKAYSEGKLEILTKDESWQA